MIPRPDESGQKFKDESRHNRKDESRHELEYETPPRALSGADRPAVRAAGAIVVGIVFLSAAAALLGTLFLIIGIATGETTMLLRASLAVAIGLAVVLLLGRHAFRSIRWQ